MTSGLDRSTGLTINTFTTFCTFHGAISAQNHPHMTCVAQRLKDYEQRWPFISKWNFCRVDSQKSIRSLLQVYSLTANSATWGTCSGLYHSNDFAPVGILMHAPIHDGEC
jgi:hypothetical protein